MPRITEISKQFRFEAAHRLPAVPPGHKCGRVHGHSFEVEIVVRGPLDPDSGWVVDFAALTEAWQPLHRRLDHQLLNDVEGLENPTSERLAHWVLDHFELEGAKVYSVAVRETCTSACRVYT